MASQSWVSLLNANDPHSNGPGTAFTIGASTAVLSPTGGGGADVAQVNAAGQPLGWYPGLVIRVLARGFVTTTTTAGTLAFKLAMRTGNTGTYNAITGAHATLNSFTTATTGIPWSMEAGIRCTAVASSGNTISCMGEMRFSPNPATAQTINTASAGVNVYMPSASGETATAIDTTQLQSIAFQCAGSAASGTLQLSHWFVEALD